MHVHILDGESTRVTIKHGKISCVRTSLVNYALMSMSFAHLPK